MRFRSIFGTQATAGTDDGSWTFKRVGFLKTRVTIRASGSDEDLAIFHANVWKGGGILELADGRSFKANTNFWMTKFEFTADDGRSLVRFRRISSLPKLSSVVEIPPEGLPQDLPWLPALGWYVTILSNDESGAAGVSADGGG